MVIGPEIDELIGGQCVQERSLAQAAAGDDHPLGSEREADRHIVGCLRAMRLAAGARAACAARLSAFHRRASVLPGEHHGHNR